MSLLNRLRPKWQNSDPEVRAEAVRQLAKDEVELLTAVAQGDADPRVRRIAVKKLDAPRLLLSIAEHDEDVGLRGFAKERARHLLVQIACDRRSPDESMRALELLSEPGDIAVVAEKAHFAEVRSEAFEALRDDAALAELVRTAKDPDIRGRALERITDPEALRSIIVDDASGDVASSALSRLDDVAALELVLDHPAVSKTVRRQARAKLEAMVPEDHPIKAEKRQARYDELCERAEAMAESSSPPSLPELDGLRRAFGELEEEAPAAPELRERLNRALESIEAWKQTLEKREKTREEQERRRQTLSRQGVAICERVENATNGGIAEVLAAARADWRALSDEIESAEPDLSRRFQRAVAEAERRARQWEDAEEREQERQKQRLALVEEAERVSRIPDLTEASAAFSKLAQKWSSLREGPDPVLEERFSRAAAHWRARREEQKKAREREEQATLQELEERLQRLEALCAEEEVSIKQSEQELREAQEFLKNMGPLPRGVHRKKARRQLMEARKKLFKKTQETRELEDWKRWANADIQESLIRRVEALRASNDLPKVAKELRAIHEEWRKVGAAPSERAQELWNRYRSIRDELKARCDEFFQHQNEEREANFEKKSALCEQVEALRDSEDWNATAEAIKEIQAQWKKIGPVPQKKSDAIWKRFRQACDHFFERRKGHFDELKAEREENLRKKEALCEQAEAIQDSTDWRQTANTLKRLQTEWRSIGPVPRKKSDLVWKRFRHACDHFFDRYKRRDEVEREERTKQREALVDQVVSLRDGGDSEPGALTGKLEDVWTQWKKLGPPPESRLDLMERFENAFASLIATQPGVFEGTTLDPAVSRRKREKLCRRLEDLVEEIGIATGAASPPLEDLAARLKDALASNTIRGGQTREKKLDWSRASAEVERLRSSWGRIPPVPGEEGQRISARFEQAYTRFLELKPRSPHKPNVSGKTTEASPTQGA